MASRKVREIEASCSWVSQMIEDLDLVKIIACPPLNLCTNVTLVKLVDSAEHFPTKKDKILLFAIRFGDEFQLAKYLRARARVNFATSPELTISFKRMYIHEAIAVSDHRVFKKILHEFEEGVTTKTERRTAGSLMPKKSVAVEKAIGFLPSFAAILTGTAPPNLNQGPYVTAYHQLRQHHKTMRSQEPRDHFTTPIRVDSTDSGDIRRQQPSYMLYNRDTYQMSPLLFESDTEDTSQSTEFKCYQDPADTAQLNTNDRQMLLSTLSNLRNEFTSPLDASSQHNQCCSETLLSSSHHRTVIETNTNSAYISPSPRVTRSKLWKSKILTRSAKRLHKISELNEYSSGPRSCRKAKTKRDSRKETRTSSDGKDTASKATDKRHQEESLIESIQKSKVSVVLERLKFPFFQNPHQVNGKFAQPNIVPNIVVDNEEDDGLEFLNRRPSSDVQLISEPPAIISISSESTVRNVSTTPRASPDLFENCDSSSASNLCSQNSIDIPNGQIAMRSSAELINSATSTPNNQQTYTLVQSIFDQFDEDRVSSDVNTARQKLIATNEDASSVPPPTFEITVNEVFDNVIYLTDSEETLTPEIVSRVEPPIVSDNVLSVTKCASSQEVTPKKRPEIRDLLNRSVAGSSTSVSTSFSRSKWLSKPRSSGGGDMSSRTPQRCRRLDRCFDSDRDSKPKQSGYVVSQNRFSNILLASSEDDEC